MNKTELWKPVPGYENYEVSSWGRVRRILVLQYDKKNGYPIVTVSDGKIAKKKKVHRLVMAAFVGESNMTVDHIDENKKNNRLENLRYATVRQNTTYYHEKRKNDGLPVGIGMKGKRFQPRVSMDGDEIWLGSFGTKEEAVAARDAALEMIDRGIRPENAKAKKGSVYEKKAEECFIFARQENGKRKLNRYKTKELAEAAQEEFNKK